MTTAQKDKRYDLLRYHLNDYMSSSAKVILWNDYAEDYCYCYILRELTDDNVRECLEHMDREKMFGILWNAIGDSRFNINDEYFLIEDEDTLVSYDDADEFVSDNEDDVVEFMADSGDYDDEIEDEMKDEFIDALYYDYDEDSSSDRYEQLKAIADEVYCTYEFVSEDWDNIYKHICEVWDEKYGKPSAEQVLAKACDAIRCNQPIRMNPVGANTYILFGDEYYVVDTTEWYELLAKKTEDDE